MTVRDLIAALNALPPEIQSAPAVLVGTLGCAGAAEVRRIVLHVDGRLDVMLSWERLPYMVQLDTSGTWNIGPGADGLTVLTCEVPGYPDDESDIPF